MSNCTCGQPVRLRVIKIAVNRKRGVHHWNEHVDGTLACQGPWNATALKPYCRDESQREYAKLKRHWELAVSIEARP